MGAVETFEALKQRIITTQEVITAGSPGRYTGIAWRTQSKTRRVI